VPTLDLAATELGGDGLLLRFDGDSEGGPPPPFGLKGALGTPEVGGVARLARDDGNVGENGDSDFPYWFNPDQSLPSTETGDMAPEPPFMSGSKW
jgi:hypothetical protein